jgi:hypothetical protein
VKRGLRLVHGDKELREKLGRNDLCPCGSGRRFQTVLYEERAAGWLAAPLLLSENDFQEGSGTSVSLLFFLRL